MTERPNNRMNIDWTKNDKMTKWLNNKITKCLNEKNDSKIKRQRRNYKMTERQNDWMIK